MSEKLKALADEYFAAYPEEQVLYISSDGQVFLKKNHSDAVNHQARIAKTPLGEVYRNAKQVDGPQEPAKEVPDETFTKQEIVDWLTAQGVEAELKEKKDDLLNKVLDLVKAGHNEDGDDDENED